MDFKTIDEYVATLSQEERERHKDLIEECRKREEQNRKSSEANREAAAQLLEVQKNLRKETMELLNNLKEMERVWRETKELMDGIRLRFIPENRFARA